jgi:pyruvate dehydrogenase E2 component (dihydrolipoamide acetyltransferase)
MMFTTLTRLARPAAARQLTKQLVLLSHRTFVSPTAPVLMADLPYHIVVGMPALSPTMDSGALAEWHVAEGDSFIAGDALAKIDTDKASMDFEAQDDGFVAKILIPAGNGEDIPVGTPMFITVEEEAFLAAFKDYVHVAEAAPVAAEAAPTPAPAAPVAAPAAPAPVAAAPVAAAAAPVAAAVTTCAAPGTSGACGCRPSCSAAPAALIATAWGLHARDGVTSRQDSACSTQPTWPEYGTTGQQTL